MLCAHKPSGVVGGRKKRARDACDPTINVDPATFKWVCEFSAMRLFQKIKIETMRDVLRGFGLHEQYKDCTDKSILSQACSEQLHCETASEDEEE